VSAEWILSHKNEFLLRVNAHVAKNGSQRVLANAQGKDLGGAEPAVDEISKQSPLEMVIVGSVGLLV